MIWHNVVLKMGTKCNLSLQRGFKVRQFNYFEMMNHKTTLLLTLLFYFSDSFSASTSAVASFILSTYSSNTSRNLPQDFSGIVMAVLNGF